MKSNCGRTAGIFAKSAQSTRTLRRFVAVTSRSICSVCTGMKSTPVKRPCGFAAASVRSVLPKPQPSSRKSKPSSTAGGRIPCSDATYRIRAGAMKG